MRVALIYSGNERSWDECRGNHMANLVGDCQSFWHTVEALNLPPHFYELERGAHPYDQNKRPETTVASSFNQWHNNYIGFSLVPKGFDVYCRVRPDIEFTAPVRFEDYNYEGLKVYIPEGHDYWGGVNDQFAFGNWESMRVYYSVYLNHGLIFKDGVEFHTERYTTENLKRNGVEIIRIPLTNHINRSEK